MIHEEVVQGYDDLMRRFAALPKVAMGETEKAVTKALLYLQSKLADYPPARAESTYRRTGTLGRLWTIARPVVTSSAHVLEARIGNATPYGPYVQDPDKQAECHRGHWRTTAQVIRANVDEIDAILGRAGLELEKKWAKI